MKLDKIGGKFLDACKKLFANHGRWIVVGSILLVIVIIGTGGFYISQHKLNKQDTPKIVQAVQIKRQLETKPVVIKQSHNTQNISDKELVLYNTMHKMINTKIVAEDGKIWGEIEITDVKCDQLINDVSKSGYPDKVVLLEFLTRWENKDFKSGVEEHNYLWDGLNGTIGKAKSLR
ncbi:DUF6241 domain-containing protein [Clostridium estertheticum]|uniref:DUF6241 domain-containing protein n=1 Tax=Clostridium estertheticum TaxID=238834 RepID=A0AA47EH30_9CLOT|nr:DUF6241 domain-containing protein [Clostridium estertheticum]MBU3155527.1 hypothetical protein [Clostridium estertheticum]MBU3198051.1 hypothetical protein [Clostridium estertheticum]WAG60074.1 DUF6241 domain-containing protein [Clostridium estertheticum]WAG65846.1 DUF6241 domain-containing protein [Clostridium estertheticum]